MASSLIGELLPSLIGLATDIGTNIPNLKKVKKRDTSARAARQGALQTSASAVGASQTGAGSSRALALRQGLRAAGNVGRASADSAASAGYADQQRYDVQKVARNARLAEYGGDLASGAAHIGQSAVEIKKANQAKQLGEPAGPVLDERGMPVPGSAGDIADTETGAWMDAGDALATPAPEPGPNAPDLTDLEAEQNVGPTADLSQGVDMYFSPGELYRSALGLPERPELKLAPQLHYKLRLQELQLQEMERLGITPERLIGRLDRLNDFHTANYLQHGTNQGEE